MSAYLATSWEAAAILIFFPPAGRVGRQLNVALPSDEIRHVAKTDRRLIFY